MNYIYFLIRLTNHHNYGPGKLLYETLEIKRARKMESGKDLKHRKSENGHEERMVKVKTAQ